MSESGEKLARMIRLLLHQGRQFLPPARGTGETAGSRILGARVVAFLAALLFAVAAWLPWVTLTYHFGQSIQTFTVDGGSLVQALPYYLGGSTTRLPVLADTFLQLVANFGGLWAGASAAGVVLAPLLWLRPHTRAARLALTVYGAWLLLATACTLGPANLIFFPPATPERVVPTVPQWSPNRGLWLALLALVTGASALATLIWYEWSSPRVSTRSVRSTMLRTHASWVGLGLLTAGILLWGLGFMAIPWATVNCPVTPITLNHFVAGRCATLDSGDALTSFATRFLSHDTWNLAGGIYPFYGVLVGGGLLVLIALWVRPPSRIICTWAALWLAGASAIAYLAYRGVGVILTTNPVLSAEARGSWVGASGVTTTLLGLLLAWLGIMPLEHMATLTALPDDANGRSAATPEKSQVPLHLLTSDRNDDEFEVTSLR